MYLLVCCIIRLLDKCICGTRDSNICQEKGVVRCDIRGDLWVVGYACVRFAHNWWNTMWQCQETCLDTCPSAWGLFEVLQRIKKHTIEYYNVSCEWIKRKYFLCISYISYVYYRNMLVAIYFPPRSSCKYILCSNHTWCTKGAIRHIHIHRASSNCFTCWEWLPANFFSIVSRATAHIKFKIRFACI